MRKIPIELLKRGMRLSYPIHNDDGKILLHSGVSFTESYINRLKLRDVPFVYIEDNIIPDIEIKDIIKDETRKKAIDTARNVIVETSQENLRSVSQNYALKQEINIVMDDMIKELIDNSNLIINLVDIRTVDGYTFSHSVNVAVLSLMTGISMGLPKLELQKLGLGAFLHDIGKTKIPINILNKKGPLSQAEFKEVEKHPYDGYKIVSSQNCFPVVSTLIIKQHHERANGIGYPEKLKEKEIHPYARIVAIADVFDALISDRPYRKGYLPHKALQILESSSDEFDLEALQCFYKHIAAYPVGTLVGLSNGYIGIVIKNNEGAPYYPSVRILCTKGLEFAVPYEIDLTEILDVVIDEVYEKEEFYSQIEELLTAYNKQRIFK